MVTVEGRDNTEGKGNRHVAQARSAKALGMTRPPGRGGAPPNAALGYVLSTFQAHKANFLTLNSTHKEVFMDAAKPLKVVSETDETNGEFQREADGKFAPGNKGGPGGSRPGSGRKPKPTDPTLLKRLYDLLDGNADKALQVLVDQLEHKDPKIAQKAAAILINKTLPETRFLKSWREKDRKEDAEELESVKAFLAWKADKDIAEAEERERETPETDQGPDEVEG
jgi:hypothetical protein